MFLINYKSGRVEEGTALAALIGDHPEWRGNLFGAYGGHAPSFAAAEGIEGLKAYSGRSTMDCLIQYELLGWTGFVPAACRNTYVLVPGNFAIGEDQTPHDFGEQRFLTDVVTGAHELRELEDVDFVMARGTVYKD